MRLRWTAWSALGKHRSLMVCQLTGRMNRAAPGTRGIGHDFPAAKSLLIRLIRLAIGVNNFLSFFFVFSYFRSISGYFFNKSIISYIYNNNVYVSTRNIDEIFDFYLLQLEYNINTI